METTVEIIFMLFSVKNGMQYEEKIYSQKKKFTIFQWGLLLDSSYSSFL